MCSINIKKYQLGTESQTSKSPIFFPARIDFDRNFEIALRQEDKFITSFLLYFFS